MMVRKIVWNTRLLFLIFISNLVFSVFWAALSGSISEFEHTIKQGLENNPLFYSLLIVFIAPFAEEVGFRLPLRRNTYTVYSFPVLVVLMFGAEMVWVQALLSTYVCCLVYFWFKKKDVPMFVVGLSALAFAALHTNNYPLSDLSNMGYSVVFVLIFSQLVGGLVLAVVRLKYSFWHAVVFHMAFNGLLLGGGMWFD